VRQRYWRKVRRPYRKKIRQRYWKKVTRRPRGRWVEFTYEWAYRDTKGVHREYWTYEVNLSKWVPEGAKPGNVGADYKDEAEEILLKDIGEKEIDWHDIITPEGKDRGGWQTTLGKAKPWTRGPFRHRWVKK